jgi:hypothetical protein
MNTRTKSKHCKHCRPLRKENSLWTCWDGLAMTAGTNTQELLEVIFQTKQTSFIYLLRCIVCMFFMWWMNYDHCTVNVFFFLLKFVGTSEWELKFWRTVREGNTLEFPEWRGNDWRPRSKNYVCFYFLKVYTFFCMMNLCPEVSIPLRDTIVGNALRGSTLPSYAI